MIGMQPLLKLRRAGAVPAGVWICDGHSTEAAVWHLHPNSFDHRLYAELRINAADIPETLDLRACVGLQVHISGERGDSRLRRLHASVVAAKARAVATSLSTETLFYQGA